MFKNKITEDQMNRKKVAEAYVDFLNSLEGSHTIALDSPWGTGKSKTIEYMQEFLDKKEDLYITYDAWDNDYTDEPFLSLVNEFNEFSNEHLSGNIKLIKDFKSSAINASKIILPSVLKGIGSFTIGTEAYNNIESRLTKNLVSSFLTNLPDELVNSTFSSFTESKKSRGYFKKKLTDLSSKIIKQKKKMHMIVIIDELDRCKPTFAISLLENIKHLFDINNIIFLIAIDKEQLAESIKAVYGQDFDSYTYLNRFFDIELHLPLNISSSTYYINKLNDTLGINNPKAIEIINYSVENFDLTLRDFERILAESLLIKLLNKQIDIDYKMMMSIVSLLILKYKCPYFFEFLEDNASTRSWSNCQDSLSSKSNYELLHRFIMLNQKIFFHNNDITIRRFETQVIDSFKLIRQTLL